MNGKVIMRVIDGFISFPCEYCGGWHKINVNELRKNKKVIEKCEKMHEVEVYFIRDLFIEVEIKRIKR